MSTIFKVPERHVDSLPVKIRLRKERKEGVQFITYDNLILNLIE